MKSINKAKLILLSGVMFIYYFIFVSITFFFSPFLTNVKGISLETVGFITVIGYTLLIIAYLLAGFLSDRYNITKKIILCNLFASFLLFIGLILINNLFVISFFYILTYPCFIMLTSLIDGLVLKNFENKHYPIIRAFGSFGAAFSYFLNSYVLGGLNYNFLIFMQAILIVILFVIVVLVHSEFEEESTTTYKEALLHIRKSPPILLILLITFLTYGVLSADDAYTYAYNIDIVGMSNNIYGISGFLSIGLEAILMLSIGFINIYILKIKTSLSIFIASFSLFLIYLTRFTLPDHMVIIFLGNIALGVFVSFFITASINIINEYAHEKVKNTILGVYQICIKLGAVLIGFITALYYTNTGILQNIYILHTILIALSFILIFLLYKFTSKGNNN